MSEFIEENKKSLTIIIIMLAVILVISIISLVIKTNGKNYGSIDKTITSYADLYYKAYYQKMKLDEPYGYLDIISSQQTEGIKLTIRDLINSFEELDAEVFYSKKGYCDFVNTYAVVYPKYPFSEKDYQIKTTINCPKKINK